MKKQTNSTHWGLILLLAVLISFCHGCITESKVDGYIDTHPIVKDSITAKILRQYPCYGTIVGSHTDTLYTPKEVPYIITDSIPCNGKEIHDTIKGKIKYIDTGTHTIDSVIDNRKLDALRIQLNDANSKINTLNLSLTSQQLATNVANDNKDYWELRFWVLAIILGGLTVWKVYSWVKSGTPVGAAENTIEKII